MASRTSETTERPFGQIKRLEEICKQLEDALNSGRLEPEQNEQVQDELGRRERELTRLLFGQL